MQKVYNSLVSDVYNFFLVIIWEGKKKLQEQNLVILIFSALKSLANKTYVFSDEFRQIISTAEGELPNICLNNIIFKVDKLWFICILKLLWGYKSPAVSALTIFFFTHCEHTVDSWCFIFARFIPSHNLFSQIYFLSGQKMGTLVFKQPFVEHFKTITLCGLLIL